MKLSSKEEAKILKVYKSYWEGYVSGDVAGMSKLLDNKYTQVGSAEAEVFSNKKDAVKFLHDTIDQVAGKAEVRNQSITLEHLDDYILVNDLFDIYVLTDGEWVYYAKLRASTLMSEDKGKWKFIHQHSSVPDIRTEDGENIATDKIAKENLELKDAIKRRTVELESKNRELVIETALERVRARTMAMQKSEELKEVVAVQYEQMRLLDMADWASNIIIMNEPDISYNLWLSVAEQNVLPESYNLDIRGHELLKEQWNIWKNQLEEKHIHLKGQTKKDYDNYVLKDTDLSRLPAKVKRAIKSISEIYVSMACMKCGLIASFNFNAPLSKSKFHILQRFAKVFDQTYTRFLDLQKAEEQAREAEIELGLERVRARAMAMQGSNELAELVDTVFEELKKLDFALSWCMINIVDESSMSNMLWAANPETGKAPECFRMKSEVNRWRFHREFIQAWKERKANWNFVLKGNEKKAYYKYLFSETEVGSLPVNVQTEMRAAKQHFYSYTFSTFGGLQTVGDEPLSDENLDILARFGKVFDLTYTRFNDLKQAEAQAREVAIELALERVRARTMAMQHSDDLREVVHVIYEQLDSLNFEANSCNLIIMDKQSDDMQYWLSGNIQNIYPESYHVSNLNHPYLKAQLDAWKRDDDYAVFEYSGKEKIGFDKLFFTQTEFKNIPNQAIQRIKSLKMVTLSTAFFNYGALQVIRPKPITAEHAKTLLRMAKVFEQTYTRFLDLQKAEEQAREAQIELALERVRARTMAMHKSEELGETAYILFQEMLRLGVQHERFVIGILDEENKQFDFWGTEQGGNQMNTQFTGSIDEPTSLSKFYRGIKAMKKSIIVELAGKDLASWIGYMKKTLEMPLDASMVREKRIHSCGIFSNGVLILTNPEHLPAEHIILVERFAAVFDQTYTRFLDLKKAEEQAREAQIEAALERVRSKSMAMHKSEDIGKTVSTLFDELLKVGIHKSSRSGIGTLNETKDMKLWSALSNSADEVNLLIGKLDMTINPLLKKIKNAWKKQEGQFYYELEGKELSDYYASLNKSKSYSLRTDLNKLPEKEFIHVFTFKLGIIYSFNSVPISEEAKQVFIRFAKVFEQTYTRFLDLQKAEEQAREAQIEAALERVRAQAMAMKESSDLLDIVVTMRKEFVGLGHEAHYFWHMRWLPEKYEKAMTSGDGTRIGSVMELPRHIHGDIKLLDTWEKGVEPTVVYTMDIETTLDYVDKMVTLGDFKQIDPNAPGPDDIRHIGGLTFVMARTTHGEIGFSLPGVVTDPPADDLAALVRFAGVFDLAYKRFEDLLIAEHQNRETEIELALERVRAKALAMQKPEELKEVAQVLRQEMGALGIEELETCSIYINDVEANKAECWYALKDIRPRKKKLVSDNFALNLKDTWVGRKMLKFYNTDEEQTSIIMKGKNRIEWVRYCEEKSAPFRGYYGKDIPDRTYHLYKFSHGSIGVATVDDISEENWGLLKRASAVFSLAYSRFKDLSQARSGLQKLKEEKRRAENALTDLKSTQTQLVHAEKMASLGELTAGIAHEIQNPLNFVNNFSEVSGELVEEINEELTAGNLDDVEEITADLKQNLEKINHHGKRASGIVKGMLEHSRTGSSEKELTDINKLADEYLRLSYHGLRAKDKSFNADFKTEFDEALPKVKVITQDLGRVILNLINNAFYACNERKRSTDSKDYKPTVTVTTKKTGTNIDISVKDNGAGIPDDIKEKIFQPFFTTKPTGSGTGLGLSMSYDIITKGHGGELKVESQDGEGTEFIIILPL